MDLEIENAKLQVLNIELQSVILNFQHQQAVKKLAELQTKTSAKENLAPHQDMLVSRGG